LHDLVVSSPVQPHIRSPLEAAGTKIPLAAVGAQEDETILEGAFWAMAVCGSSTWIRQD
jgi:hypothetical protein